MSIGLGMALLGLWFLSGVVFWIAFVVLVLGRQAADEPVGVGPSPQASRDPAAASQPTTHHVFARSGR